MTQTRPIVTLTTDFGLQDPFVGIMKGVIAGICPAAHVIDITHGVATFDVLDGALAIWQAWRYFPAETIHVVVIDPGVGSERLPVLARMGSHWFVAPDNGVLTMIEREALRGGGAVACRRIENREYMLPVPSSTFHGRDIFAPAAAHLAAQMERGNITAESFGTTLSKLVQLSVFEPMHNPDCSITGTILKSDKFGNLLTNIGATDLPEASIGWSIEIGDQRISRFARYYSEIKHGEVFAILGSSGLLELAINRGSAQEELGVQPGTKFRLVYG